MKSLKVLGAGAVLASGMFSSVAAAAVSGNLAIASEYIFRGLPSSGNAAAVSGGLDWESGPIYAGTWMSNVSSQSKGNEVDFYAGFSSGIFDVGAIVYLFPGDPELSTQASTSHGNLTEVYGGINAGMFSGYLWYGLGADNAEDDEYIYLEGNFEFPIAEATSLGLHLGVTSLEGDAFGDADEIIDLAATLNYNDFFVMVSMIPEHDDDKSLERPRFNLGYSWSFDDVL